MNGLSIDAFRAGATKVNSRGGSSEGEGNPTSRRAPWCAGPDLQTVARAAAPPKTVYYNLMNDYVHVALGPYARS
jgi:hypothetical protein